MLVHIPNILNQQQISECQELLHNTQWIDGNTTAGHQAKQAKNNVQLAQDNPIAADIGAFILNQLSQNQTFMAATLPNKIYPPMFNCYQNGGTFGDHIDNAIRNISGTGIKVRTDVSCTLFLNDPSSYEGGELVIQDTYGQQRVKFAAGDLVIYPSTSMHHVTPVTKGQRLASFFWLQSLIRSDDQRRILYDLDLSIQALTQQNPQQEELVRLTGVYHNLLRQWGET
ncbi:MULTISPECIES: Fe2+-dependent dioxygenase [Pseudoalteromonas]|uniref:Fe2+-dependent dioxygenase n=1 Tax=Pseudoalteromonas TaxID=53246 RepID=UPI0007DB1D2D|nr:MULTISPECIES: Fe2+-dependent dioxygenase [Pseudoalteromonas]NMR25388.1 Fe2+-dependent dioxygenase [Pseudoalteromonas sp. NEC-BIFX-2020_015]